MSLEEIQIGRIAVALEKIASLLEVHLGVDLIDEDKPPGKRYWDIVDRLSAALEIGQTMTAYKNDIGEIRIHLGKKSDLTQGKD